MTTNSLLPREVILIKKALVVLMMTYSIFVLGYMGMCSVGYFLLSGGIGVIKSISPDFSKIILIRTPFCPDPLPEVDCWHMGLFQSPIKTTHPKYFIFHENAYQTNDHVWENGSKVFYAWKNQFPIYAYDFENPNREFLFIDPYYARFHSDRKKPMRALVDDIFEQNPSFIQGLFLAAIADGNLTIIQAIADKKISLKALSACDYGGSLYHEEDGYNGTIHFFNIMIKNTTPHCTYPVLYLAGRRGNKELIRFLMTHGIRKTENDELALSNHRIHWNDPKKAELLRESLEAINQFQSEIEHN